MPKGKKAKQGRRVAPPPSLIKKRKEAKESNPLFEKTPKSFGIGEFLAFMTQADVIIVRWRHPAKAWFDPLRQVAQICPPPAPARRSPEALEGPTNGQPVQPGTTLFWQHFLNFA